MESFKDWVDHLRTAGMATFRRDWNNQEGGSIAQAIGKQP
jgi:hypothetical protein